MVKYIELTNSNELVLVDDEDYNYLNQFNWRLYDNGIRGKSILMQQTINRKHYNFYINRLIAKRMNLDLTNEIDHIDRNIFNNQRNNLRSATSSQNKINRPPQRNNSTGYKGVCLHKCQKYIAQIVVNRKNIYLGLFKEPEDAAKAYDKAAKYYFGEYAYLNFLEK